MILAFVLPLLIGGALIVILSLKARESMELPLDLCLAFVLGVGICSQLTFFQVLAGNGLSPITVQMLGGGVTAGLLVWMWRLLVKQGRGLPLQSVGNWRVFLLILLPAAVFFFMLVAIDLYGGWDAWSLWNFRANAIFRGGQQWWPIFHNEIQGKHPWLLPFFIDWGWSFSGGETPLVPVVLAGLMTISLAGIFVFGLSPLIGRYLAALAGFFLLSIPDFIHHSASQYADIFVAAYSLAAIVCLQRFLQTNGKRHLVLLGSFLALLAFSKDEGIVLGVILILFLAFSLRKRVMRGLFWWPLIVGSVATIMCELLMRTQLLPAVVLASPYYGVDFSLLTHLNRWAVVGDFFLRVMFMHPGSGFFWAIFLPVLCWRTNKGMGPLMWIIPCLMGIFIFLFSVLYVISTTDLIWRLQVTITRLAYQMMPIGMFYLFWKIFTPPKEQVPHA